MALKVQKNRARYPIKAYPTPFHTLNITHHLHIISTFDKLNSRVRKYSNGTCGNHTNRAKWVAPEAAFIVVDAVWGHYIGASTAYWASWWGTNVS